MVGLGLPTVASEGVAGDNIECIDLCDLSNQLVVPGPALPAGNY